MILVEYFDGFFKYLENKWIFEDVGEGISVVGFYINYEFWSWILELVMGVMFDKVFRKFFSVFEIWVD